MTTFADLYPDAHYPQSFDCDGDEVLCIDEPAPCFKCATPCTFASISFHAHFCSPDCLNATWNDYFEALRRPPSVERGENNDGELPF